MHQIRLSRCHDELIHGEWIQIDKLIASVTSQQALLAAKRLVAPDLEIRNTRPRNEFRGIKDYLIVW